jgi:putative transposase
MPWARRPESARRQRDRRLKVLVRASFERSKRRYGSPRIHRDLCEEHAERVSRKRVIPVDAGGGLESPHTEALHLHD